MIKNYRKHLSHLTKVKSQERADRDEQEINDDKKKKRIKQKLLNYNTQIKNVKDKFRPK
jgi:hypothetical protein